MPTSTGLRRRNFYSFRTVDRARVARCCVHIGKVLIGVHDLRQRCIMTAYDPDMLVQEKAITRGIYQRLGGTLALNCFVIVGGELAVGGEVRLMRGRACAESAAPASFAE